MVSLFTDTPQFFNDICDEIRLFEDVRRVERAGADDMPRGVALRHSFSCADGTWRSSAEYYENGARRVEAQKRIPAPDTDDAVVRKKLQKRLVKQSVYDALKKAYDVTPPWGSLTGIRPAKLFREFAREGGAEYARKKFLEEFEVSPRRTELAERVAMNQAPYIEEVSAQDLDIYIGVPFCATRCKYCSFVSRDITRAALLKDAYLDCLREEMRALARAVSRYRVRALYVGGGTPTALAASELDALLAEADGCFPRPMEYTVEAGRPDTITPEKLEIISKRGAARISVNAQTTNQRTLDTIGRRHSAQDFFDAFSLARKLGFGNINTDVILGLPGENLKDVRRSLEDIAALSPENITVHTLAIKNASEFAREQQGHFCGTEETAEMAEYAREYLRAAGYEPYYLYRQKYMSGNMENTGYARPGCACRYNIDNMEETVSVLAFGAGGISKRLFHGGARIERAANVKDVGHYVARSSEMAARKTELFSE